MSKLASARVLDSDSFLPKFITALRQGYALRHLRADAAAAVLAIGTLIGVVLALSLEAGTPADQSLIAAGSAICVVAVLGGSSFQVGAPTALLVVAAAPVLAKNGAHGLTVTMFATGALLFIAAFAGWHTWVRHLPTSVIIGVEAGVGVLLAWHAIEVALSLGSTRTAANAALTPNIATVGVLVGSLLVLIAIRHRTFRSPGELLTVVIAALVVRQLHLPVETLGDLPLTDATATAAWHDVSSQDWARIVPTAFTLALLIGVQSLRGARMADARSGRWHRPQGELLAQGIANMAAASLGGLPVGGDPMRTIDGLRAGAQSPLCGVMTGLFILAATPVLLPWLVYVPTASLCAVLLLIAWDMCSWSKVRQQLSGSQRDHTLAAIVAVLVVFVNVNAAVTAGVLLAVVLTAYDLSQSSTKVRSIAGDAAIAMWWSDGQTGVRPLPADIDVFEVRGPLVFGSAHQMNEMTMSVASRLRALVLDISRVPHIDATGIEVIEDLVQRCERQGTVLIVSQLAPSVRSQLRDCGILRANRFLLAGDLAHAVRIAKAVAGDLGS